MALKESNKNRKKKKEVVDMGEGNINFPEWEKLGNPDISIQYWVLLIGLGIFLGISFFII